MNNIIIAIDGPAGAGKSTIAKILSDRLSIDYIDTGAMYRAITYKCLKNNIDFNDTQSIIQLTNNSTLEFKDNIIYLDKYPLNDEIRSMEINEYVSHIAQITEVRIALIDIQRKLAKDSSVILDGRDIGSYVFPNADYKFFLVATPEERGRRRFKELKENGHEVNLNDIINNLIKRDSIDSNREFSPLTKASDAIEIDTTGKSIEDVCGDILSVIKFN